jgi:hypothetical protein
VDRAPSSRVFFLIFALQLRKKQGKTSVTVRETSVIVQYTHYQSTHTLQNLHTHTHAHMPTHTHTPHARPHPQTGHWHVSDHIFYPILLCIQLMAGNADEAAVVQDICDKWTRLRRQALISHPQPKDRCRISKKLNAPVT